MTNIMALAPPFILLSFGCTFAGSFLVNTAQNSFLGLGKTLTQGGGAILSTFQQVKDFLGLIYENILSL